MISHELDKYHCFNSSIWELLIPILDSQGVNSNLTWENTIQLAEMFEDDRFQKTILETWATSGNKIAVFMQKLSFVNN